VRFSLQAIKKHVHRRGGELFVSLHFLRPGEPYPEIDRLVSYHEQLLGQPQRHFSIEDACACIGDDRLAHCLVATLSAWYSWRQTAWQVAVQRLGSETLARFEEGGIASPLHLRLALFDYVNEHYSGFLATRMRPEALAKFAALYCGKDEQQALSVPALEYLLALDSDVEALLVRDAPLPPSSAEVAALYNQWVFEAALFNASDIHFVIDCNAFMRAQRAGNDMYTAGIGAVIKRLCYLARKLGVYYDLAYEADPASGSTSPAILHLTLYGPQEMTGAPQQYGLRLARLCRMLMDYNHNAGAGFAPNRSARSATLPSSAIIKAEASVHFLQRSYRFVIDTNVLRLLPRPSSTTPETRTSTSTTLVKQSPTPASAGLGGAQWITPSSKQQTPHHQMRASSPPSQTASSIFDSSIEQSFAEAFHALANSDGADGWQLEREPEPLLLNPVVGETTSSTPLQGIFIPDFALTRDNRRIYVEILGFWTSSYRERKIAKLHHLVGRGDLVLAIPVQAREGFTSLGAHFPLVEYDGQLSATELLQVLRSCYDDLSERLARIDVDSVRKRIENAGLLPERACYELLHCYRRSELLRAAERVAGESIAFTPGVGLYHVDWLEHRRVSFVKWLGEVGGRSRGDALREDGRREGEDREPVSLSRVLTWIRTHWPALAACEDATLEAIIGLWPEVHIRRSSIFEATVAILDKAGEEPLAPLVETKPKKSARERRTLPKKPIENNTTQGDLWG
jgi:predicted nuclease of restriction endonuclease-like RecB superfamily